MHTRIANGEFDYISDSPSPGETREERIVRLRVNSERAEEANRCFKAALEEEFGTFGHPKADTLWRLAWEKGHSSGLSEVYYEYDNLVELIL